MDQKLRFSSKFFGSTETFLNVDEIVIEFKKSPRLVTQEIEVDLETVIYPGDKQAYFFFSVQGIIFRLRLYDSGEYLIGDIRKRIGYQDYELISLLKCKNQSPFQIQIFQIFTFSKNIITSWKLNKIFQIVM